MTTESIKMTLAELKRLLESARWFANLGKATESPGVIAVNNLGQWQRFNAAGINSEFGLPHDSQAFEGFSFAELAWLPTAHEQQDPIHGDSLSQRARELNRELEFKSARLEVFRLALDSQRGIGEHSLLKIGGTDLNEAARMGGRFASRMAASEIVVDQPGFWCRVVRLYFQGQWPFGYFPGGVLVVL